MTVKVCIGSACHLKGSYGVITRIQELVEANNLGDKIDVQAIFCLGHCVDAVSVETDDGTVHSVSLVNVDEFFEKNIKN